MESRVLLSAKQIEITTIRMAHQLIEVHRDFSESYIIGIQPRGVMLAERMGALVSKILGKPIVVGK
ncbi:MAG: bifunctional pyr operon transcriptional regulator/uracil phosphoribosyltransferase PyrR, partial [Chitinophagales bacterium]|nr:bifunctional pyr operon transcriptional regulator/uracil phosphoribosyltransferase PyrR [Chitinophagales bacterium]